MAAPNIVNSATITGDTDVLHANTSLQAITTNSGGSNKVYKINSLLTSFISANVSITLTVDVTLNRSATDYYIAKDIEIPSGATLVVISKDMGVYLEEGDSIQVAASHDSALDAICSYEIIDDA